MVRILLKHKGIVRSLVGSANHHLHTDTHFITNEGDPKSPIPPANTFVGITSPAPRPVLSHSFEKEGGMLLNKIKFNKKSASLGGNVPKENTARIKFVF